MNNKLIDIKHENELIKKELSDKYYENRIIDTELAFINHLKEMRRNNHIITVSTSLIITISFYFGINSSFDPKDISDIIMLIGSTTLGGALGAKASSLIYDFILKDINYNNNKLKQQEDELTTKKELNIQLIDHLSSKLIKNNNEIENIYNNINNYNNDFVCGPRTDSKAKKLVLKRIV